MCAALWFDPVDELCPERFRDSARDAISKWCNYHIKLASKHSYASFLDIADNPSILENNEALRATLLHFIADFSLWENSHKEPYLTLAREITYAAHHAAEPANMAPLVVDPFAGGGSIPVEALRLGADTFSSELNPVAVLINKVELEFIPKYSESLVPQLRKWCSYIETRMKDPFQNTILNQRTDRLQLHIYGHGPQSAKVLVVAASYQL